MQSEQLPRYNNPQTSILDIRLNCIKWLGFNPGTLENAEYPFIAIILSTLIQISSAC